MAKTKNKLKGLRSTEKKAHAQEVAATIKEVNTNKNEKLQNYQKWKKLQYWHYLIILSLCTIIIGFSFIIGLVFLKDIKKIEWVLVGFGVILLVLWFILGWQKNRQAAQYFNDSRRRYQPTLTEEEATIKKARKIILATAIIVLTTSLIMLLITSL
ncbi:hypothetical protein [Spiroplasma chrysopicola]|uniref:DUF3899 domain-containing protein n=1 Tax=Spiroplasma chrysopicola DF-1 TaxID=1276227 RepID=R4UFP5_9MOLU|nr:hypothetical protein [Spiroplasma chrysopicola]AGM24985.1 hypothetical protein SCHRY_v1c04030 [Spiroplasma chrysopicola DF-1]